MVFRIFLKKKLHSGDNPKTGTQTGGDQAGKAKNRRQHERYPVDQQHLTVLNDQDILVIRDISAKGFSSEVSSRAFDRFELGDMYAARMRYNGEVQDIEVKVAWKREKAVGFELHRPQAAVLLFFQRLLRPIQLARSLSLVDAAFMRDQHAGLLWFHGENVDLYLWQNEEEGLAAWQLVADQQVIEWSAVHGLKTGTIQNSNQTALGIVEPGVTSREIDEEPDPMRLRFALDLITAMPFNERHELAKTLDTNLAS